MGIDSGGGDSRNRLTGIDNESISIGVAAPPPPLAGGRGGAAGAARRFLQLPPRRQPAGRGRGVSGIVSSIVSSISARPPALTRRPIVDGVDFWIVFFFGKSSRRPWRPWTGRTWSECRVTPRVWVPCSCGTEAGQFRWRPVDAPQRIDRSSLRRRRRRRTSMVR